MKKTRKAHLWIGVICSIFILTESITGLLMNEPWLIGQSQTEKMGNFQPGQMGQGMTPPGMSTDSSQSNTNSQTAGQTNNQNQPTTNSQTQGKLSFGGRGGEGSTGSLMSIIKGLHEGRIGSTDVKWLIDLTAIAMIFLTGSGIYLSLKVISADRKRKARMEKTVA